MMLVKRYCLWAECGRLFQPVKAGQRYCGDGCREAAEAGRKAGAKSPAPRPPADPDRVYASVVVTGDYTAAKTHYLRLVDALQRRKRFPTAIDYFDLVVQAVLETGGRP